MVKGIIFDADGTIWDSSYDILDSMNKALRKFGLPTVTRDEIFKNLSYGAKFLCDKTLDGRLDEKASAEFLKTYNEIYTNCGSPLTRLYDGVDEMLIGVKKLGVKIAMLSNKPQQSLDPVCDKLLRKYEFDFIYGQREGFKTKPARETTEFVIENLGVDKQDVVMVGDSEIDYLTGKNAGLRVVSCLWGFRTKQLLVDNGADLFIDSPAELVDVIKNM